MTGGPVTEEIKETVPGKIEQDNIDLDWYFYL